MLIFYPFSTYAKHTLSINFYTQSMLVWCFTKVCVSFLQRGSKLFLPEDAWCCHFLRTKDLNIRMALDGIDLVKMRQWVHTPLPRCIDTLNSASLLVSHILVAKMHPFSMSHTQAEYVPEYLKNVHKKGLRPFCSQMFLITRQACCVICNYQH